MKQDVKLICELKEEEEYKHKQILWNPPLSFSSFYLVCLEIARRPYRVQCVKKSIIDVGVLWYIS
jgi:hypothetical protein